MSRIYLAGTPPATVLAATSFVTTDPAAIMALSSLNISYEFGADVLRKLSIDRLKFSLIGNELFRSSTVKMERGLTYPFARTFTFAMQVSF